ncbi:hypothetical protein L2E82_10420 [Cichorium intybus]|uniref:Uncharacterized protein n=1 Tax=Cichorium intybus TaxID=13427 RepID=A0ACB9GAH4_CICIN|nr:hypothetical protein L2E82_10420 [Cichorium intybus]
MTMEEIFKWTKDFKQEVFEKVQLELNQFGLWIYNANVKQLVDVQIKPGSMLQKTQMKAAFQAMVDVAEANMKTVEIGGSGVWRGRHGLKVRPGGLFHEPILDRNLVT